MNTFVMNYIYQKRTGDTVVGTLDWSKLLRINIFSLTTISQLIDLVVVLITDFGNTYLVSK